MKKPFIQVLACLCVMVLSLQLSSCMVMVAGAVAGGSLVYYHKTIENYAVEKKITMTANRLLQSDRELQANSHLVVVVNNGMLLLIGEATTAEFKQRAEAIVQSIDGITRIYNQIVLSPRISWMQKNKDAATTTKIKLAMLGNNNLDPSAIKVITENNVVYLMGVITQAQADRAVNLAKRTHNVSKVVKVMQYITTDDESLAK